MNIINMTPHEVVIYQTKDAGFIPKIRKYVLRDDATPVANIPSSGMLSVQFLDETWEEDGIMFCRREVAEIDPIPEGNSLVIVSALYASAARQAKIPGYERLVTIGDPVYEDKEGKRPIGCLKLLF